MSHGSRRPGGWLREPIVCADGFEMSVQASEHSYCEPRENDAEQYISVEIGFPSQPEAIIQDFADDPDNPTGTVYGYVPVNLITNVIVKHGGIVSGEVPPGVIPIPCRSK